MKGKSGIVIKTIGVNNKRIAAVALNRKRCYSLLSDNQVPDMPVLFLSERCFTGMVFLVQGFDGEGQQELIELLARVVRHGRVAGPGVSFSKQLP